MYAVIPYGLFTLMGVWMAVVIAIWGAEPEAGTFGDRLRSAFNLTRLRRDLNEVPYGIVLGVSSMLLCVNRLAESYRINLILALVVILLSSLLVSPALQSSYFTSAIATNGKDCWKRKTLALNLTYFPLVWVLLYMGQSGML